jgi:THUMP domain-containing protein
VAESHQEPPDVLTVELLEKLQSEEGQALLARAAALADDPFAVQRLRAEAPPELAAAAVEQVRLRRRAAAKFSRASGMWFTPSLLEQSSGEVVSRYRAMRFARWAGGESPAPVIGDLGCGLGADAIFLAEHVRIAAVDRDPVALALTRANAVVFGRDTGIELRRGDLPADAPEVPAAWVDPGRREEGEPGTGAKGRGYRRTRRLDRMSPTLAEVLSMRARIPHLGIKLSPATDHAELDRLMTGTPHEREVLSVKGECRELALWLGDLAAVDGKVVPRRATLLPAGAQLAGEPVPSGVVRPPGEWLLEPDAAVIRAGLVGNLGEQLGAWAIDPRLAYLSAEQAPDTPFARVYRIEPPAPFGVKRLGAHLRELEAGDVVFKTRGAAVEPEILRRQLRRVLKQGRPDCRPVVFITRLDGRPVMMVGESLGAGAEQET